MKKIIALFALLASVAHAQTYQVNNLQVMGAASIATPLSLGSGGTGAATANGALAAILAPTTATVMACDRTGATDATACVQAVANSLTGGGRLKITGKLRVSNLTVPAGVTLEGDCVMPGTPGTNASAPYGNYACGVLMVAPSSTVTLGAGAAIKSVLMYPAGMTFPQNSASSFAGTAITVGGDDASIDHVMILGFNKAVYASGYQRTRVTYVDGDNNTGIEITNATDRPAIEHCHMWPFATVAGTGGAAGNQRTGDAYYLHDTVDDPALVNDFAYGYKTGFHFKNISTLQVTGSTADNTGSYANSTGWLFEGNINGYTGVGNASWSQTNGAVVNVNAGQVVDLSKMAFNTNTTQITVTSGHVKAHDSEFFQATTLLSVSGNASIVELDGNTIANVTNNVVASVPTNNVYIGPNNINLTAPAGTNLTTSNVTAQQLTAADPLNLPPYGTVFVISGNANFGNVAGYWPGREVTLVFTGTQTVFNGTGSPNNMALKGGTNFTTGPNTTLRLIQTGTQWYQE